MTHGPTPPPAAPGHLARERLACPKQPAFKVHKGRRKETKELFLATKLVIVRHAVSSGLLENSPPYKKLTPYQFMDFSALGDNVEKRNVCTVRDWAVQSVREGWEQLAADETMKTRYGPSPLSRMRRVPAEWCHRHSRGFDTGVATFGGGG